MIAELIASLLQAITDLIPRFARRPLWNEFGVLDTPFTVKHFTRPQLVIPLLAKPEYYPKTIVPINLELQRLTTADGCSVTCNVTALVKIGDPVLLREVYSFDDWEAGISADIRGVISEVIAGHNWADLLDRFEKLVIANNDAFSYQGVDMVGFVVEDFVQSRAFTIMH